MATTETVTMLVTDDIGPAHTLEHQAWRALVEAGRGRPLSADGAGALASFSSAAAAVACAVELHRRGARHGGPLPRIGVATGEAEAVAGGYVGRPIVEARRLWAEAAPGQILASELVRLLAVGGTGYRMVPIGSIEQRVGEPALAVVEVRPSPGAEEQLVLTLPVPLPALLTLESPVSFVARSAEWAVLAAAWMAARDGRRAVLVAGEAGAGKTRLITEFARDVHLGEGAIVLYGGCAERSEQPFQPFAEALDHALAALPPDQRRTIAGDSAGELVRLLPSLRDTGALDTVSTTGPDAQRYRMFEAVVDVLARLSASTPVLLFLDDVHWARRPTLDLLDHVLRSTRLGRLCLVASFRNAPADVGEWLRDALPDLRRRPGVERLSLSGFDRDGVHAFVAAMAGHDVGPALEPVVQYLLDHTDGNAFLLGELWRHIVESGRMVRRQGRWVLVMPLAGIESPETVREVVSRRVGGLPEATRSLLEVAAVAGASFDLGVVASAAGSDPAAALDALAPAVAARLIDDAGADRFRFAHALVRQSVEDALGPGTRRRHHLAVGRTLEALGSDDVDRLAHHFVSAVPLAPVDLAVRYARQAAAAALRSAAYENAGAVINSVLPLVSVPGQCADLLLDRAEADMRGADTAASIEACAEAAALARRLGDRARLIRAALVMQEATWRGNAHGGPAVALLREALVDPPDDETRARLLAGLSNSLAFCGLDDEALLMAEDAIAAARQTGNPRLLVEALICPLFAAWQPRTLDRQLACAAEGVALADAMGDDEAVMHMVDKQMGLLLVAGDPSYRAVHDRHGRLARQQRQPLFRLIDLQLSCARALNEGRLAAAEEVAEEANRWSDALPHASGGYGVQMFSIRREQGRLQEVRPVVEAVARLQQTNATWRPGLAALYAELGLYDAARSLLDELVADDLAAVPRDSLWCGSLSYLADAAVATGHRDAAATIYQQLHPYAGYAILLSGLACYGAADRYLGRMAALCGRTADATARLEAALRLDEAMGSRTWVAHSQLALAQHLAHRGHRADRGRVVELLTAARSTAVACGLTVVAGRADAALAALHPDDDGGVMVIEGSAGAAEPDHVASAAALTERELTVLRLVAEGYTNREVGERLNLSQHTVANHLRSILLKTGCANRTEAAMYAQRRGLLTR